MLDQAETATEVRRLSQLIDAGITALRHQAEALADAENEYRKGKAEAWLRCPVDRPGDQRVWTSSRREAWVDGETADLRRARDVAEGLRQAALEAVRARKTQVSALQSLLAAERAEAEFTRTGPRMTP